MAMSGQAGPRRVVITGLGVVSSIGMGAGEFLQGLRSGSSGAKPITVFDVEGFDYANGCEVVGFEPERWIRHLPVEQLGRATSTPSPPPGWRSTTPGWTSRSGGHDPGSSP